VVHPEKFTRRYENYHRPVQNPSYQQMLDELAQPERFFDRISAMLEPYRHVPDDKAALSWYGPLREAFDKLQEQKELILSKPVIVYDPAPAMVARRQRTGQDQFLRTDTHWTPQAMAAVADGLAGTLQEAVGIDRNPGRDFQRETTQVEGQGDIAVMMQLPDWQDIYPPQAVRVEQVLQGETFWRPDPSADVLLLGDSFSNIYSLQAMGWGESAGLAEQLSYRLGRSIDAIRRNDAGAHATREMLSAELARGIDRLAGKKVVVWQFASRELAVGDWRVDSTPMQLGQRSMSDLLAVEAGKPIELVGRVLSATPAPRPGSVNYAEHVIHLHLGDLQAVDGSELPAGEALAATMSMRQGQWTPAARYRPGQQVHMRMYNFEEYDANYSVSGFNSSVPDDPDLMLAQPVWGEDLTDPVEGAQAETEAQSLWPDLAAALGVILAVCLTVGFLQRREGRKYHDEIQ
ncbi:MAG: alginate O-acetyltransferase AlgX-related protein, partial [Planctomycetota bacterium]